MNEFNTVAHAQMILAWLCCSSEAIRNIFKETLFLPKHMLSLIYCMEYFTDISSNFLVLNIVVRTTKLSSVFNQTILSTAVNNQCHAWSDLTVQCYVTWFGRLQDRAMCRQIIKLKYINSWRIDDIFKIELSS